MTRSNIRLILQRRGCANRPFFHIAAQYRHKLVQQDPIEQIGSYDPMPNMNNETLIGINFERLRYYMGTGAKVSLPVAQLLGFAGFLPIHPRNYMNAWRRRNQLQEEATKAENEDAVETTN